MAHTRDSEEGHIWHLVQSSVKSCAECNLISAEFVCDCGAFKTVECNRGKSISQFAWDSGHRNNVTCKKKNK